MNLGKCPKCGKPITKVRLEAVQVVVEGGKTFNGASYVCSLCFAILSVSIDPLALQHDTAAEVIQKLRG